MIFTGHSLGAAGAQVAAVIALNRRHLEKFKVLSIGFGTPMCVDARIVEAMDLNRWSSSFLTIINENDPVPSVLNVADTFQQLNQDGRQMGIDIPVLFDMIEALADLSSLLPLELETQNLIRAGGNLVRGMRMLSRSTLGANHVRRCEEAYMPLGVYVIMGANNGQRTIAVCEGKDCKRMLGGAKLLQNDSLSGLNETGLIQHSLPKYRHAIVSEELKQKARMYGKGS